MDWIEREAGRENLKSYNEEEALNILKASLGGSDPIHSQNHQTRKSNQAGWRVGNDFSARRRTKRGLFDLPAQTAAVAALGRAIKSAVRRRNGIQSKRHAPARPAGWARGGRPIFAPVALHE
jgi:hypothetical protein